MEPPDLHSQVVQADTPDPQNIDKLKSKFILYVAEFYIPTLQWFALRVSVCC